MGVKQPGGMESIRFSVIGAQAIKTSSEVVKTKKYCGLCKFDFVLQVRKVSLAQTTCMFTNTTNYYKHTIENQGHNPTFPIFAINSVCLIIIHY